MLPAAGGMRVGGEASSGQQEHVVGSTDGGASCQRDGICCDVGCGVVAVGNCRSRGERHVTYGASVDRQDLNVACGGDQQDVVRVAVGRRRVDQGYSERAAGGDVNRAICRNDAHERDRVSFIKVDRPGRGAFEVGRGDRGIERNAAIGSGRQ